MPSVDAYLGPLIAFLGTLAVAGMGAYQWKRQYGNPNRGATAEARRKAAEAIWSKLEELSIELRGTADGHGTDLRILTTELNSTFLRNSLYLDDSTQRLASDYLKSLTELARQINKADEKGRQEWSTTMIKPVPASASEELSAALSELEERRERVKRALLNAVAK